LNKKNKDMMQKIHTFCERSGFDFDDVVKKINSDAMFASTFATDPAKQNLFEKLAREYIQGIDFISDFKKLSHHGKEALYIVNGSLLGGDDLSRSGGSTEAKSIDFSWKYKDKKFYAFHKYTRQSGGAQDNQYNDMKAFINHANSSTKGNYYFIAIADGEYFNTQNGKAGVSKIENLKNMANNSMGVYAVRIEELYDVLKTICNVF